MSKAKPVKVPANQRPLWNDLKTHDVSIDGITVSAGEHAPKAKGVKIRGTGAATKGTIARGPMA